MSTVDTYRAGGTTSAIEPTLDALLDHVRAHDDTVAALWHDLPELAAWGRRLAEQLTAGARLIVIADDDCVPSARQLAALIVGHSGEGRPPLSAIALPVHAVGAAGAGDADSALALQVHAHARPDDIVLCLSTDGHRSIMLPAIHTARASGAETWAITGPAPDPLADTVDAAIAVRGPAMAAQEAQLLVVHLLFRALDEAVREADPGAAQEGRP
jgi:D-sedoheptulose 7-phosphate isomerase